MTAVEPFPSLEQIVDGVLDYAHRNPAIATLSSLGRSPEGREVHAVEVTDPAVATESKQVAIVVCGRHGNELGTRAVGTALLEWLASRQAAETRRLQRVVVVPVANPDGCARGEFHAPGDGLSRLEEQTLMALAERCQPDAVVDVHSLAGSDVEAVIKAHTTRCAEDEFIHDRLAAEMTAAAGRRGYAFDVHAVGLTGGYNNFFAGACYERYHSVAFGMEVNHAVLSPSQAGESGVAAIAALLEAGNRRFDWQHEPGYPNEILIGDFSTSIRPAGADPGGRRRSRVEVWRNRQAFAVPRREIVDPGTLRVTVEATGGARSCQYAICCRVRGRAEIRSARLDGRDLRPRTCRDDCSTYAIVQVDPRPTGKHELIVEFATE